jgi:hypothetical protein
MTIESFQNNVNAVANNSMNGMNTGVVNNSMNANVANNGMNANASAEGFQKRQNMM